MEQIKVGEGSQINSSPNTLNQNDYLSNLQQPQSIKSTVNIEKLNTSEEKSSNGGNVQSGTEKLTLPNLVSDHSDKDKENIILNGNDEKRGKILTPEVIQEKTDSNKNDKINNDNANALENEGSQDGYDLLKQNENENYINQNNTQNEFGSSKNVQEENTTDKNSGPFVRTVTVVEHESGFKSTRLAKKQIKQLSVPSHNNSEPLNSYSDKISFKTSSDNSKQLSSGESMRLSLNEQAVDYIPDQEKLTLKPASRNKKSTVTFKEEDGKSFSNNKAAGDSLTSSINKSSSTKIVSILKNSKQGRLSNSVKDDQSDISNTPNEAYSKDTNFLNVNSKRRK